MRRAPAGPGQTSPPRTVDVATEGPTTFSGSVRLPRHDEQRTVVAQLLDALGDARLIADDKLLAAGHTPGEHRSAAIVVTVEVEVP